MITLRAKFIIISESKSYFFETMSKILKLLFKLIRKKRQDMNYQYQKDERCITIYVKNIKIIMRIF